MKPVDFDESNTVLGAPPEVNRALPPDEQVKELPAFACQHDGGVIVSCWELSAAEMAEVMLTGKVWLTVFGGSHPPVSVNTENPFQHSDEKPLDDTLGGGAEGAS